MVSSASNQTGYGHYYFNTMGVIRINDGKILLSNKNFEINDDDYKLNLKCHKMNGR